MSEPKKDNISPSRRNMLRKLGLLGMLGAAATAATATGSVPTAEAAAISFGTPGIGAIALSPGGFVYDTPNAGTKIGMLVTTASLAKLVDFTLDYFGCIPSWEAASSNGGIGLLAHGKRPIYALTGQQDYGTAIQALARGVGANGLVVTANKNDSQASANQYVTGILASANSGYATGAYITASGTGSEAIYAFASGTNSVAARFGGNVEVQGNVSKAGGTFKIDHPLDPENKYLLHSFVESPERKNIYDGNAKLDEHGNAVVELPGYFETLNTDYRYQLTAIGQAAPTLHIAEEIKGGSFKIAGGQPGLRVSWQVTGNRQDAWAKANPLVVEEEKPKAERGYYLHPEAHGQPATAGLHHAREEQKKKGLAALPPSPVPTPAR